MNKKKNGSKLKGVITSLLVIAIICVGGVWGISYIQENQSKPVVDKPEEVLGVTDKEEEPKEEVEEIKETPIFSGTERPVAVMIDNEKGAWPQAGLNSAYMLYEFIIEGGATRIMAFFKGAMPEKLGPVRSSRHYFLDYAMEHDALYVHFGWSPKAQSDIKTLGINNINGIYDGFYWREEPKGSYHNAFTSMANIWKYVGYKGYRKTSDKECIVKFNEKDTDIESETIANDISIKYSNIHSTSYTYDEESKTYLRSMRGEKHADRFTGERFYAKNIIAIYVRDELLDDPEDKGRRELYNIGSGDGYYITNGKAISIKWTKTTRSGRTIYKDLDGNEISVNNGITWVQVVPITGKITIK